MIFSTRMQLPFITLLAFVMLAGCTTGSVTADRAPVQAQKPRVMAPAAPRAPQAVIPAVPVGQPRRVALLLPQTGPQAAVGESLTKAAMLAVQELAPANLEVDVEDTAKGADAAFAAAQAHGAQLIIGPLFSADVQKIRDNAAASGIPVLALSNDTALAGQGVNVMGFWPGAQISRVLLYAQRRGLQNIAVIIPDDAYGSRVEEAVRSTVTAPARVVTLVRYNAQRGDFNAVASQLAQARGQYDALLVPTGGSQLFALLAALNQQDLLKAGNGRQIQLLGSGLWDEPELQRRPELYGAWYAAPDPTARLNFTSRYQRAFGEQPVRIASLAYDATALAAVLAARNWPYSAAALTQGQGFEGVDGFFRLQNNGLVDRGLAVLQFSPTGLQMIEPAPKRF